MSSRDGGYGDGGASEFAGGGFMPPPSTPTAGISGGASTFSPSAGGRARVAASLHPFTVRHLSKCFESTAGDALVVNSTEITNVVVVGSVGRMESRTTDISLILDDGTGKVEIRRWHDDEKNEADLMAKIKTGGLVKVHGVPRKIANKITISANSIRPIEDFNEYTCHFLDCIFAFQYSKSSHSGVPTQQQQQGPNSGTPQKMDGASGGGMDRGSGFVAAASDSRVPLHERVLKFFLDNSNSDPTGLHRDFVVRGFADENVPPKSIIDAIDFLLNEGHLYSTVDDLHYKALADS